MEKSTNSTSCRGPSVIKPGSTIGILGGGQLGKMIAQAAATLGYHSHLYCPNDDSPAFLVATKRSKASYNDAGALRSFAKDVDIVTFEFENIPHGTIQILEEFVPVYPNWECLHLSQNRLREKRFVQKLGIKTTPFEEIHTLADLQAGLRRLNTDCLLKTVELGYDGKGQHWVDANSQLEAVWETFEGECGILEAFVPFDKEISVIVARKSNGTMEAFPPVENHHTNGILSTSKVPAKIEPEVVIMAQEITKKIAEKMKIVGLLATEFFVTDEGTLLFNEMAPRPHNSGHWTLNGCNVSQFEQMVRAICNLPLIKPFITNPTKMVNLIGYDDWEQYLNNPCASLYLYGKKEAKPGRKMGHVNLYQRLN